jgi:hypothetical protein
VLESDGQPDTTEPDPGKTGNAGTDPTPYRTALLERLKGNDTDKQGMIGKDHFIF